MRHIRPILLAVCSLLCAITLPAANLVTSVLTVTNVPVTGNVFYFASASASSLRYWTNQTTTGTILTNLAGLGPAASNLFNALGNFPLAGITSISQTNTNTLVFKGTSLVVTQGGNWASIISTTNTGTNVYSFVGNFDYLPPVNRTNQASEMIYGLSLYPSNSIATNAVALSNHVTIGVPYGGGEQTITARKYFGGGLGATNIGFTNGFTRSITNINPVASNLVNYGNAIRSEGSGANSFQAGSNAQATALTALAVGNNANSSAEASMAIGNSATATNAYAVAVGNGALAKGNSASAWGPYSQAVSNNAFAIGPTAGAMADYSSAIGDETLAYGSFSIALGPASETLNYGDIAIGVLSYAHGGNSIAIGHSADAGHTNSVAIGANATTTSTNQIRLGTASECVSVPGAIQAAAITNSPLYGTNLIYGSLCFPRYDLSTLAAGNNISVPFGTNTYIRLAPGPASSPTLCGLIGGATSGGENGETKFVFNDTGYPVVFAVNTVDPVPANRISSYNSSDFTLINQGFAQLFYDAVSARWKLASVWPQTNFVATYTNAVVASANSFGTNETFYQSTVIATNGAFVLSNCIPSRALIINSLQMVTNEPDATLWNLSGNPIKNYTNALTSLRTNTVSVGSVTGVNWGNGITGIVASGQANLGVSLAAGQPASAALTNLSTATVTTNVTSANSAFTSLLNASNQPVVKTISAGAFTTITDNTTNLVIAATSSGMWTGTGVSLGLAAGIYKYCCVSGMFGTAAPTTNTTVATYPVANLTITSLAINTTTLTLGSGTNLTVALQTNGVDAFTAVLTGNASRTHALTINQAIPVTTNDTMNVRFSCDGAVGSQFYGTTVGYTIP